MKNENTCDVCQLRDRNCMLVAFGGVKFWMCPDCAEGFRQLTHDMVRMAQGKAPSRSTEVGITLHKLIDELDWAADEYDLAESAEDNEGMKAALEYGGKILERMATLDAECEQ